MRYNIEEVIFINYEVVAKFVIQLIEKTTDVK